MQYKFDKNLIQQKLIEKGATLPCHRCGKSEFAIIEGATNFQLQETLNLDGGIVIGGASMPVIHIVCTNCGAITSHAIGGLGLINLKSA